MTIGQELEFIRKKAGLSIVDICNIMDVSETDYEKICSGSVVPTIYQLIMINSSCQHALSFV